MGEALVEELRVFLKGKYVLRDGDAGKDEGVRVCFEFEFNR